MNIVILIIVIVAQFIAAQILGFAAAIALSAGEGLELVVFAIGNPLGVWGVGWLATRLLGSRYIAPANTTRLVGALAGAVIGVGLIVITPPLGFAEALFPLIGALIGYYLAPRIRR